MQKSVYVNIAVFSDISPSVLTMTSSVYTTLLLMNLAMFVCSIDDKCPYQKCACYGGIIRCDYIELKKLPPLYPVNTTQPYSLLLSGNSLTTIRAGALPSMLTSIDFQQNPIKTIDKDAFNGSADTLTQLTFENSLFTELPEAFLRLNNLTSLQISDMQITTWNIDIIKHIGDTLQTLILNNVGLNSWPTWFRYLPHLGMLDLSSSSFSVPDDAFDNQINTLFSLSLQNGILTEIPSAVTKLTKLQFLFLNSNNISKVTGIPNSPVMATLQINNNKISDAVQLSDSLLSVSGSLNYLDLDTNQLTFLPDLSAMDKLETLYISGNAISNTGTSEIPASLNLIDIEANHLKSIALFMRNGLNLSDAILQNNFIEELLGVDIPISVQSIYMSFNLITELTDESFPPNSNLQYLNLDSNPISKVSAKAFANLSKLTLLSMSFNKLTRLPLSLTYLTSAEIIELGGNDGMICTCMEKDAGPWAQNTSASIFGECGVTSIQNFLNVMSLQCPD